MRHMAKKGKPLNCCNSSAARRVPEHADSICESSNRGTSGTQEIFPLILILDSNIESRMRVLRTLAARRCTLRRLIRT
jgi:hypothetical protein